MIKDDVIAARAVDDADQRALRRVRACLLSDDLLGLGGQGSRDDPSLKGSAERFTRGRRVKTWPFHSTATHPLQPAGVGQQDRTISGFLCELWNQAERASGGGTDDD